MANVICPSCGTRNADGSDACSRCERSFSESDVAASSGLGSTSVEAPVEGMGRDTVGGRYRLKSIIGRGGVGVVYAATDLELGEELAIKFLKPGESRDPKEIDRFKSEIKIARKITHPNVIRIHDFGMDGSEAFISMELLQGGTLANRIEKGLSLSDAVEIAVGICEGLAAAHQDGIVHRDLKPENVLFDGNERPKIVDFGLARLSATTSRTVGFSGTPFYMSPEQAAGKEATPQSDIYSIGVVLYEMFTGQLPFAADNLLALAMKHTTERPKPANEIRTDLPAEINAIIMQALEKNPADRPASANELASVFRAWSDRLPKGVVPEISAVEGTAILPPRSFPTIYRPGAPAPAATPSSPASDPTMAVVRRPMSERRKEPLIKAPPQKTRGFPMAALLVLPLVIGGGGYLALSKFKKPPEKKTAAVAAPVRPGAGAAGATSASPASAPPATAPGGATASAAGATSVGAPVPAADAAVRAPVSDPKAAGRAAPPTRPTAPKRVDVASAKSVAPPPPPAPAPAPVAAPASVGYLTVRALKWGGLILDGKKVGEESKYPVKRLALPAGPHTAIVYTGQDKQTQKKVQFTVQPGLETEININFELGTPPSVLTK